MNVTSLVPSIERFILLIRGKKVMLDTDLATLYEVPAKRLNQQVTRNLKRFPEDFSFILTNSEFANLRSQIATSSLGHGGRRHAVRVFTEQGVAMLSSVLNSDRAIEVNIEIMRAFAKMRDMMFSNSDLAKKLQELEKRYDSNFKKVFEVLTALTAEKESRPNRRIGFSREESAKKIFEASSKMRLQRAAKTASKN